MWQINEIVFLVYYHTASKNAKEARETKWQRQPYNSFRMFQWLKRIRLSVWQFHHLSKVTHEHIAIDVRGVCASSSDKQKTVFLSPHYFHWINFISFAWPPNNFLNENMWQKIRLVRSRDVFVSFTLILLTIINLVPSGECLYEDQVGKFDW